MSYLQDREDIFYILDQIGKLVEYPTTVEYGGLVRSYSPASDIFISEKLFRSDRCQMCGKCCDPGVSLIWGEDDYRSRVLSVSPNEYMEINLPLDFYDMLRRGIERKSLVVNGVQKIVYVYKQQKRDTPCDFLFTDDAQIRCGIHPSKPIGCALPLISFIHVRPRNVVYIRKQQHGRNHLLGCPIVFTEFVPESFRSWERLWLGRMKEFSNELDVCTRLPDILSIIDDCLSGQFVIKDYLSINKGVNAYSRYLF